MPTFSTLALRSTGGLKMSATKIPDKITKVKVEEESHPVGTAVGAAGGAGAGALGGAAVGGPVGAAVGAAVGAVVGAVSGHAAAEALDPTVETDYWRLNYKTRPYYKEWRTFGDYEAAYQPVEKAGVRSGRGTRGDSGKPRLRSSW
jgi:phage tail tape-measure protein